jgi:hypothetical protein
VIVPNPANPSAIQVVGNSVPGMTATETSPGKFCVDVPGILATQTPVALASQIAWQLNGIDTSLNVVVSDSGRCGNDFRVVSYVIDPMDGTEVDKDPPAFSFLIP